MRGTTVTISFLVMAALALPWTAIAEDGSLFDPGFNLNDFNTITGFDNGTTTNNPSFDLYNGQVSSLDPSMLAANTGGFGPTGFGGGGNPLGDYVPPADPVAQQLLSRTLQHFLKCAASTGLLSPGGGGTPFGGGVTPDPFGLGGGSGGDGVFGDGFGTNSAPAVNITDTSNPGVRYCIETARQATASEIAVSAIARLRAEQAAREAAERQDMMLTLSFLGQEGGNSQLTQLLPLLLNSNNGGNIHSLLPLLLGNGSGEGGGGLNPALFFGGGF